MTNLRTILRRVRLVLLAVAAIGLLVLPSVASAKRHDRNRDRNHNGIADKWEKRYHLKGRALAKADPDKDGLNNRAEWRSHTNPRKPDSDGDGVADASEDPDRDNVDNGNEAREGTNPRKGDSNRNGVKDGKEDADHDALNNAGEDAAGTDPINPDSDDDGVKDGDEKAGEIVSFDGTTLTLRVFGGATISGTVDENTWIECGAHSADDSSSDDWWDDSGDASPKVRARSTVLAAHDEPSTDDPSTDDPSTDDPGAGDGSGDDPSGDDGSTDSTGDGSGDWGSCATDTLKVGAVVTEATLVATPDGVFFDSIAVKPATTP